LVRQNKTWEVIRFYGMYFTSLSPIFSAMKRLFGELLVISSTFTVNDTFLNQYMFIIIGGVAGVAGVLVVVFIIRRRRYE